LSDLLHVKLLPHKIVALTDRTTNRTQLRFNTLMAASMLRCGTVIGQLAEEVKVQVGQFSSTED
jgi:hypothetical protein